MMASVVNTDASAQQMVQPCNTSMQCKIKTVGKSTVLNEANCNGNTCTKKVIHVNMQHVYK
jgi:hypothetical protein